MEYDVVVVGGGHNGLTCGAYLARAGASVLVVERRNLLGGCATSEHMIPELPEWTFNTGATELLGFTEQPVYRDFHLDRWGLELLDVDPCFFMPFPDGSRLFIWRSAERTAQEIERISPADAESYLRYVDFWTRVNQALAVATTRRGDAGFSLGSAGPAPGFAEMLAALPDGAMAAEFMRVFLMPSRQYIEENFNSSQVKGLMAFFALQTQQTLDQPASLLSMSELVVAHHAGVARPRGGCGRVADAIASAFRAEGGETLTGRHVEAIEIKDGRAAGVRLAGGETVGARGAVVAAISPLRTFLSLIDPSALSPGFRRRVAHLQNDNTSVIKAYFALDQPPIFTPCGDDGSSPDFRRPAGMVTPSVEYADAMWADVRSGQLPTTPWMWCTLSSVLDPSMAPAGKHALGLHAWVPYRLADGRPWARARDEMVRNLLSAYAVYAPNVPGAVIGSSARTPEDWEAATDNPKGDCFHIDFVPHQVFGLRPLPELAAYRTPIAGLYLSGAGTHPGPALTGLPGHNTAQAVIEDLNLAPATRASAREAR
jgi:phytoene dehydrogenase-like protein